MMHGHEKSDPAVVASKPANKAGEPGAERVERRAGAEGNADQRSTHRAQNRERVTQALGRGSLPPDLIRWERRKAKEEGTVHRASAPRQPRHVADGVLRAQAQRRPWRGWADLGGLRGRPRAKARGPARPGPPRSLSAATVPPDVHTEGGRPTAAAGDRRPGRQDRPGRGRHGAERDLRGRLPRVLVWVPTRTWPARCAGCTGGRDHQHQGELDTGRRHPELFRHGQPGMADPFPGTPNRRSAHHPPDPEMAAGGGARRWGRDGQ